MKTRPMLKKCKMKTGLVLVHSLQAEEYKHQCIALIQFPCLAHELDIILA